MESKVRTFQCDVKGCRSYCTLHPTDSQSPETALKLRGWGVVSCKSDALHYCPAHKDTVPTDPVPEDMTETKT